MLQAAAKRIEMNIQELKNTIDSFCKAMKLIEEKSNANADLVKPARAELAFFGLYLMFDEGSFDEEELELIEEASGYRINRDCWNEIMEVGRVDSEKNYLSQPPHTFMVMVDLDNLLYGAGEEMSAYDSAYEVYKLVGDYLVNRKGFTDEKRLEKLGRFLAMVEGYRKDKAENVVKPSKKGVTAPKKS